MRPQRAHIVQLPFPSLRTPHERIEEYYRDYGRIFSEFVEHYFIPEGSLWELPLWVAHLAGMLESLGYSPDFIDLSATPCTVEDCAFKLLKQTRPGEAVLISPLAQNFDLAIEFSRTLMTEGRITILGGNMAPLAKEGDATVIHRGQATPDSLAASLLGDNASVTNTLARKEKATWLPSYRLLESYRGRVPLLRLNASHGCLFACDFCGDAWSRQLVLVPPAVLENEIEQFERLFPNTRLIYIGDKTFGQSKQAVQNLLDVFARRPKYRFIVQTHVLAVNDQLIEAMKRLGVVVVEMGFESASTELLQNNHKPNVAPEVFVNRIARLSKLGIHVILNILGGLPGETREAHEQTLAFIHDACPEARLYNLYNFVPYPLTRQFGMLRSRIFDWNFSQWREDGPPVFHPYHMTAAESFQLFIEKVGVAHDAILRTTAKMSAVQQSSVVDAVQSTGAR
jgi:uncharacterized radical SAM superfamily protein